MSSRRVATAALAALVLAWLLPGLVGHEPWKPDEAYSFGLVYHVLQTGDWVVPTLAGEPFMEKPPLFYVSAALFARLLGPWLALPDAARLASGFYMGLTFLFSGLAATALRLRGAIVVLAMLACPALISAGHLLVTDTALLAGLAVATYGFALFPRRPALAGIVIGTGSGIAFLSKGLIGPGLVAATAALLPVFGREWRNRDYGRCLLLAAVATLPWLIVWPVSLFTRSPELFERWLWDNNFGRYFGFVRLGPRNADRLFYIKLSVWYFLPIWPVALWGIWSNRTRLREPQALLPLCMLATTLLVLTTAADARQIYVLPATLPLALLVAWTLEVRSPPWLITGLISSGSGFFALALGVLWGAWAVLLAGLPLDQRVTQYLQLPPFDRSYVHISAVAIALGYTLASIVSVRALSRTTMKGLAVWAIGTTTAIGIAFTLFLGWLDVAKSYRAEIEQLQRALPDRYRCIERYGVGEPQRALLAYYANIMTLPSEQAEELRCDLLLAQEPAISATSIDNRRWREIWRGHRPGDTIERLILFAARDKKPPPADSVARATYEFRPRVGR